ncbi:TolC family protein [Aliifodinibius sp. 1BSP15-2V2]|uniref:TolC family protein n=2 Tax=Fodinibius salsisoli TaxID=2820877 RepID=A0ABT3PHE0_9BACT|nr:TolC family protein [Fodinibius salsisoli]
MDKYSRISFTALGKAIILIAVIFSYTATPAVSQQADTVSVSDAIGNEKILTLTEAIHVAMANNSQVKRSLLSLRNADEQVRLAWSEVLPDISALATYTRNLEIPVNFVPAQFFDPEAPSGELVPLQFGTDNNWQGGLSVSQTLFRGEAIVGIGSSKVYKAVQSENLRATAQQIVTQTRIAYYNVLAAEEQYRLQKETVDRLQQNLEENKARQEAGLIDQYDVLQVQVQLGNQQPQLTQAKYTVEQAYRELSVVLGIPLEIDFNVQGNLNAFNVKSQQASEKVNEVLKKVDSMTPYQYTGPAMPMEQATDMRGDIRVLEKQNALKNREIKAIKSRFLPTLSANYNLNWTASQAGNPVFFGREDSRARSQTLGFTLSLPIFEGFERSANLSIAQIEKKDLEEQRRAAVRSAKNEIQSARESLDQAIETAPAREKALELAQEGYDRARTRLENGLGSQLDVTNAELQLRQAEANYAQMVSNYLSAKAQYDRAVGIVPFVDESRPTLND